MTRETLEALKKLEAKATAGPWEQDTIGYERRIFGDMHHDEDGETRTVVADVSGNMTSQCITGNNAFLIVAARNNLPQLLRIAEAAMELNSNLDRSFIRADQNWKLIDKLREAIGGDDDKR